MIERKRLLDDLKPLLRELEEELAALGAFHEDERRLAVLMADKERLEAEHTRVRLDLQRLRGGYGPQPASTETELEHRLTTLRSEIEEIDGRVAPLARAAGEVASVRWGPLLRAGNDLSLIHI